MKSAEIFQSTLAMKCRQSRNRMKAASVSFQCLFMNTTRNTVLAIRKAAKLCPKSIAISLR